MLSKRRRHQSDPRVGGRSNGSAPNSSWSRALQGMGCDVTQATISRDVRELGLEKRRDAMGRPRYVLPETEERRDPEAACARMLDEFATAVHPGAEPGDAEVRGGDGAGHGPGDRRPGARPRSWATVAGDDTVLIVTQGRRGRAWPWPSTWNELGG